MFFTRVEVTLSKVQSMWNAGVSKIISGGQTGADQGALLAARELGIETGGAAPQGWLTEEGPRETLLRGFGLVECDDPGYAARTRANVTNSDGTFLVGQHETGGSALTFEIARELSKPLFHVGCPGSGVTPSPTDRERFLGWIGEHNISTLNVAGERESRSPGIGQFTREFLVRALRPLTAADSGAHSVP